MGSLHIKDNQVTWLLEKWTDIASVSIPRSSGGLVNSCCCSRGLRACCCLWIKFDCSLALILIGLVLAGSCSVTDCCLGIKDWIFKGAFWVICSRVCLLGVSVGGSTAAEKDLGISGRLWVCGTSIEGMVFLTASWGLNLKLELVGKSSSYRNFVWFCQWQNDRKKNFVMI